LSFRVFNSNCLVPLFWDSLESFVLWSPIIFNFVQFLQNFILFILFRNLTLTSVYSVLFLGTCLSNNRLLRDIVSMSWFCFCRMRISSQKLIFLFDWGVCHSAWALVKLLECWHWSWSKVGGGHFIITVFRKPCCTFFLLFFLWPQ
jgi:hypothetical protein